MITVLAGKLNTTIQKRITEFLDGFPISSFTTGYKEVQSKVVASFGLAGYMLSQHLPEDIMVFNFPWPLNKKKLQDSKETLDQLKKTIDELNNSSETISSSEVPKLSLLINSIIELGLDRTVETIGSSKEKLIIVRDKENIPPDIPEETTVLTFSEVISAAFAKELLGISQIRLK